MPRRLDREAAASFMLEHGLEPLEQYPGAGKQWRCRCLACGDEVRPATPTSSRALSAYLGQREMKQGGWTETVSAEEIDLAVTIRRIQHLAEGPDQAETLASPLDR